MTSNGFTAIPHCIKKPPNKCWGAECPDSDTGWGCLRKVSRIKKLFLNLIDSQDFATVIDRRRTPADIAS